MVTCNWDEEESDLSPLESDDDDDEIPPQKTAPVAPSRQSIVTRPSTQEATVKSRGARTPHLRPARTSSYSSEQLYNMLNDKEIDLDPEYQRDVVWTTTKQSALIDSLMHNYYMPPIIFSVVPQENRVDKRICIDGKQRLTSIKEFMDGRIPHKDTFSGRKSFYVNPPGHRRRLISKTEISQFRKQQIVCVEYDNITDEDEREIFQRVQMGVALTPAERMNAINAPYATLARELQATRQRFDFYLKFEDTRGREYLAILQVIVMIMAGFARVKISEPTNSRVETFLNKKDPVAHDVRTSITMAVSISCLLIQDPILGRPLCNGKFKLMPIELVMTIYFIHLHLARLSLAQLSDGVQKMRDDLRKNHKDVRFSIAFKHMLVFVTKTVTKLTLNGDGKGDKPAGSLDVVAELAAAAARCPSSLIDAPSPGSQTKRKRGEHQECDTDSDDDRPLARPRPQKGARKRRVVESDDEVAVRSAPPPKPKTSASRTFVRRPSTVLSSKAATTVKQKSKAAAQKNPKSTVTAGPKSAPLAQTGKPSVKPPVSSRTSKTTDAAASSSTLPTTKNVPNDVTAKTLPIPPSVIPEVLGNSKPPTQPPQQPPPQVLPTAMEVDQFQSPSVKIEPIDIPVISSNKPYDTYKHDRLAPMRRAKEIIANSPVNQATYDPRRPPQTVSTPPSSLQQPVVADPEVQLGRHCELLEEMLQPSPVRPSRRSSAKNSPTIIDLTQPPDTPSPTTLPGPSRVPSSYTRKSSGLFALDIDQQSREALETGNTAVYACAANTGMRSQVAASSRQPPSSSDYDPHTPAPVFQDKRPTDFSGDRSRGPRQYSLDKNRIASSNLSRSRSRSPSSLSQRLSSRHRGRWDSYHDRRYGAPIGKPCQTSWPPREGRPK